MGAKLYGRQMSAAATQAWNFTIKLKQRSEIPLEIKHTPPVMDPEAVWYALITAPQREDKAERELHKSPGLVTYVPRETYWTARQVQKRTLKTERQKPLIPRYVFITGAINWFAISRIEEVAGVMAFSGVPRQVPTRELARLAEREREGWFDERRRLALELAKTGPTYQVGDLIRITGADNPFKSLDGLVDADSTEERVTILVSIFGRETPMVLPLSEIEMVTPTKRNLERGAGA